MAIQSSPRSFGTTDIAPSRRSRCNAYENGPGNKHARTPHLFSAKTTAGRTANNSCLPSVQVFEDIDKRTQVAIDSTRNRGLLNGALETLIWVSPRCGRASHATDRARILFASSIVVSAKSYSAFKFWQLHSETLFASNGKKMENKSINSVRNGFYF